jgi:hypothetical protein
MLTKWRQGLREKPTYSQTQERSNTNIAAIVNRPINISNLETEEVGLHIAYKLIGVLQDQEQYIGISQVRKVEKH